MANIKRKLIYKVYQEDDTYLGILKDVVSDLSIEKTINGGDSEFTITLARKIDDFEEDTVVKFNNRIKVYLQDSYNPDGDKLIAYGYIVSYAPRLSGNDENIEITCLSAVSKLKNDFYRTGTASTAAELGVELTSKRADEMMEEIINHYRLTETYSMLSNDYSNSDSTPNNDGSAISFTHRFFNMKHLDAIREASKFLPRNKSGGYFFYWRISTDGKLYVKNISTTADHTFIIGSHITTIDGRKTIEGVVNRVYFWNEKGTADPDYIKLTSEDVTSQNNYDIVANYITDSKITTSPAASLVSASRVYDKKDAKVKIKLELNGDYDLSSITPGQTCQILNAKNNPFVVGGDRVLLIHTVRYDVDTVTLEVSDAQERFEDVVEEERMRLDLEMTWFGKITQMLTAAQLSPATRAWTTTITFSATTGADAYRQIDWTAGTIYIPAGASGSAAKRIIDIGNTGLMSPGSTYYVYLDEDVLSTTAAVVTRTGTSKQGGDTLTDDGSPGWSNDQYKGYVVEIGSQKKIIKSNTASVLTLEDRWTVADQSSQTFTISKLALSSTTSEETAMSDNRIVFTNAAANTNTDSDAILVPNAGLDIIVDGATQIAQHSIVAANLITTSVLITASAQIDSAVIQDAHITGTLTVSHTDAKCTDPNADQTSVNTSNDTSNVSGTPATTIETGANRGYNGLNTSYQIVKGFLDSHLNGVALPTNGIRVDSNGIYGRASGVTTFYVSNLGSAYFSGQLVSTSGNVAGWVLASTTFSKTTSLRKIELSSSVPHVKIAYNNSDVIQLAVVGSEPKLEVYYGGNIRTRLNKNGLYFFNTSGVQRAYLYGSTTYNYLIASATTLYCTGDIYSGADLICEGELYVGPGATINRIDGDGAHVTFYGSTSAHLVPVAGGIGSYKIGTASNYWGEINYKTLTDRGCLGCFDGGVELQDGRVVSDCESLQAIKKHPVDKTIYGIDKLDYSTFPKVAYKPVKIATKDIYEDVINKIQKEYTVVADNGKKIKETRVVKTTNKKLRFKKGEKMGEDGVEMTSMFSIMIGAIKEVDKRLQELEK